MVTVGDLNSATTPGAVLFACNFNRVRSPMAEALMRAAAGDRIFVDSCGIATLPSDSGDAESGGVDPFVEAVMAEIGCPVGSHRPKRFEDLQDNSFDLVIALTPDSYERAGELARGRAVELEHWPTYDPTLAEGSREARLSAYREVRDELARRIAVRFSDALQGPIDLAGRTAL